VKVINHLGDEVMKVFAPAGSGKLSFCIGDTAIRRGDESIVLTGRQAEVFAQQSSTPLVGRRFAVDVDCFRILAPEYVQFVERPTPCSQVERALRDARTSVASIIGIGGMGKTALATWSTLRAYEQGLFDIIVSTTAKDRELLPTGIQALTPGLSSFDALLDSILEVTGFGELRELPIQERERDVRGLLEGTRTLLYVDNLETVDDARIIQFLDDLPPRVRAITTSRRATVRVAVRPIDLEPLHPNEAREFVQALAALPGLGYAQSLSPAEIERITVACNGIPLAIQWTLARAEGPPEALRIAEAITQTGKTGEELLEFTFRRVFDAMSGPEKTVLQVLSLFQGPQQIETVVVGGGIPQHRLVDALESLVNDALVQRSFDSNLNDYVCSLLPVTRVFVYSDVCKRADLEGLIRKRLHDYFEAMDVPDSRQRAVVRDVRQGRGGESEAGLLDLARAAERRGQLDEAEGLYEQALLRNPTSWRAARFSGEFQRHKRGNIGEAIRLYERAAGNSPARGQMTQFLIADTFPTSLARLTGDEQKAAKTTAFDLQLNPASPGMQFHKLGKAKDKNFWSVRVNADLRLIVHRSEGSLLLCYVGHHDDAYRWAESRKLERHPTTGAAQIVELRESGARDRARGRRAEAGRGRATRRRQPAPKPPLFPGVPRDELLAYGVPEEWVAKSRGDRGDALRLADHLPPRRPRRCSSWPPAARRSRPVQRAPTPIRSPTPTPSGGSASSPTPRSSSGRSTRRGRSGSSSSTPPSASSSSATSTARRASPARPAPARPSSRSTAPSTWRAAHPEARVLLATFSDPLAEALHERLKRLIGSQPRLAERSRCTR
jgi:tetratricopeptide (TPR) repeat protein